MKLIKYETAKRALSEARRVDEVKAIRDKAIAVEAYAKQAKDITLIEHATDIRMRAEIRAGEILAEIDKNQGAVSGKTGRKARPVLDPKPKLSDMGVTKSQSSRWQALANMPKGQQEGKIAKAKRKARNALDGTARRERTEMRAADEARVKALQPIKGKFKTLVIDPPWDYEWLSLAGRAKPGYATMTHEELLALRVSQWAEDNCHLYLWTTNNFMTRAVELMAKWGFQHKTVLTWVKPRWGLGSYFRNSTEHVLFGVRGELRTRSDSIATHFNAPTGEHSAKPEEFYKIVRKASYLPAGELFQCQERKDFINIFEATSIAEAAE